MRWICPSCERSRFRSSTTRETYCVECRVWMVRIEPMQDLVLDRILDAVVATRPMRVTPPRLWNDHATDHGDPFEILDRCDLDSATGRRPEEMS